MANEKESEQPSGADTPPVDQPSEQADSQTSPVVTKAFIEALMPLIREEISKGTQSTKDKRIQKLTNQMGDFESLLAEFKEMTKEGGLTEDQALWRMKVESQLRLNEAPPEETIGNQSTPEVSVSTQAILQQLGLDENNPGVTKILRESKDLATQLSSFINLSTSQKQTEPNPAAVQPTGGGKTSYESVDAVVERLDVLFRYPSANKEEIDKLTARLIELEPKVQ